VSGIVYTSYHHKVVLHHNYKKYEMIGTKSNVTKE